MDHDTVTQTGEITPLPKDKIRVLSAEEEAQIKSHYVPLSPEQAKTTPEYCVDGRTSGDNKIYAQALGGAYNIAVAKWLLGSDTDFTASTTETFRALQQNGYACGIHTDTHGGCGCGFVKRLGDIIGVLKKNNAEIWGRIIEAASALKDQAIVWEQVMAKVAEKNPDTIPSGETALQTAEREGATLQTLRGDHAEIAAVVNTQEGTTLDVTNNQATQAFNLDLWYVAEQARELKMNEDEVKLLTLGLFAATEIVLVEAKGEKRLPILVR